MRSLPIYGFLAHRDDGPVRHPLVVGCHFLFVLLLLAAYILFADKTPGQNIYFLITVGLYLASAAQHTFRPDWMVNFLDQTLISWYVLVTPLPFIYHEGWAVPIFVLLAFLTALNKWYELEPDEHTACLVFLTLGGVSFSSILMVGLPTIGAGVWDTAALLMYTSTVFFTGKLVIYRFKLGRFIPEVWESPESGHLVLSWGVTVHTYLVIAYPV